MNRDAWQVFYEMSMQDHIRTHRKRVERSQKAYDGLADKDTHYACAVKKLLDLHKQALAVYEEASDGVL